MSEEEIEIIFNAHNDNYKEFTVPIKCKPSDLVETIQQKFIEKAGFQGKELLFLYDSNLLNAFMTVKEQGLTDKSEIIVTEGAFIG